MCSLHLTRKLSRLHAESVRDIIGLFWGHFLHPFLRNTGGEWSSQDLSRYVVALGYLTLS